MKLKIPRRKGKIGDKGLEIVSTEKINSFTTLRVSS